VPENRNRDIGELEQRLLPGLVALELSDRPALVTSLLRYLCLLDKWNQAFNLTAVRDPLEMVTLHLLDSLSVRPWLQGDRVLDAGTGAGLPGIPLALAEPARRFVLLDSSAKKTRFVRHALGELSLDNVEVVQARAEAWQPDAPFATVISRAFTALPEFVARCAHLTAPGGRLLAMKGRSPDTELSTLPAGWRASEVTALSVPGLDARRHIVVVERTAAGD
jgi:16S rRNA (guanine527-N7)-methyltransferase